jgi:WD40 repeat protein
VRSRECISILEEREHRVNSVAFSPDGRLLASGSEDGTCEDVTKLWNVESGECIATFEGYSVRNSVAFSPDGRLLASGASHWHAIKLWDVESRECIATLQRHTSVVTSLAFSPNGRLLASGSWDGTVMLWDMTPYTTEPNRPPAVSDIPDQTIEEGKAFSSIGLDDYVSDPDSQDLEITWTYAGNTKLNVSIDTNRVATIAVSEYRWSGSEIVTFTARDPGGLSASDSAKFSVTPLEFEPGDVNGDGVVRSGDAIIALRISGGLMEPTYYQKVAADMNGDGEVKANDAIVILRKAAGLEVPDAGQAHGGSFQ